MRSVDTLLGRMGSGLTRGYPGRIRCGSGRQPVGRYVFPYSLHGCAKRELILVSPRQVGFGANKVFTTAGTADKVAFLDKLSNGKVHPINYREQSECVSETVLRRSVDGSRRL